MSLAGILIGVINICIYIALFLLVGVIIKWIVGLMGYTIPAQAEKLFLIIVALSALVMLIGLLLGTPLVRPIIG